MLFLIGVRVECGHRIFDIRNAPLNELQAKTITVLFCQYFTYLFVRHPSFAKFDNGPMTGALEILFCALEMRKSRL